MLLQSLLLVVALALIGSAVLTSTLVSAKSAFHEMVMRQSRSAMTDATASLISWAQDNVRKNGIDQLPVWAAKPQVIGPEPACGVTRQALNFRMSAVCELSRTLTWNMTGYTDADANDISSSQPSEATNLATAQGERRLSATVNIEITDATGQISYARQSREVTARLFHAYPYVAVTGERDASSEVGTVKSAEGDTGGFLIQRSHLTSPLGVASLIQEPAGFTDTTVVTTIDCVNTTALQSLAKPFNGASTNFVRLRPYGNLAWSYEAPCLPKAQVNLSTAPQGYQQPRNTNYGNDSTINNSWTKGDYNNSSFAH